MAIEDYRALLGDTFVDALKERGFADLTEVQSAVIAEELAGKDLRVSSQTGSGKTVALGLAVREFVCDAEEIRAGHWPRALVITPTRELATQVESELSWLYARAGISVAAVTGGASYITEKRALAQRPGIVVGTPGRLIDHLERGHVPTSAIRVVVLDEADRMLDMGFRDELLSILGKLPEERRTHLVSATFPREVKFLADRVQADPTHVQGTPLGTANQDIEHVLHVVMPKERLSAMINLLLLSQGSPSLIFAKTRADVGELCDLLGEAGFRVRGLSGELEQRERTRALTSFKRGELDALVATDVAARGIDVQDIGRVIHAEPPTDADTYVHRSGRTGRAGRQGKSHVIAMPSNYARTRSLLERARVQYKTQQVPGREEVQQALDERMLEGFATEESADPKQLELAEKLLEGKDAAEVVALLLGRLRKDSKAEPRELVAAAMPEPRAKRGRVDGPRTSTVENWETFRVSWGQSHGADTRRLLAMVCRRGNIRGTDVGSIKVLRTYSVVDVNAAVAKDFDREASQPDPRDARVIIRRASDRSEGAQQEENAGPENAPSERGTRSGPPDRRPSPFAGGRPSFDRGDRGGPPQGGAPFQRERGGTPAFNRGDSGGAPPFQRGPRGAPAFERPRPPFERNDRGGPPFERNDRGGPPFERGPRKPPFERNDRPARKGPPFERPAERDDAAPRAAAAAQAPAGAFDRARAELDAAVAEHAPRTGRSRPGQLREVEGSRPADGAPKHNRPKPSGKPKKPRTDARPAAGADAPKRKPKKAFGGKKK